MNQCDGCRRGLLLRNGIHSGPGYDYIGCTKDRYSIEIPKGSNTEKDVYVEIGYSGNSPEKKYIRKKLRLESVKDKTLAEIMEFLEND